MKLDIYDSFFQGKLVCDSTLGVRTLVTLGVWCVWDGGITGVTQRGL